MLIIWKKLPPTFILGFLQFYGSICIKESLYMKQIINYYSICSFSMLINWLILLFNFITIS